MMRSLSDPCPTGPYALSRSVIITALTADTAPQVTRDDLDCADALVDEVTDLDRADAGVMAAIGAVYCSGTRSPY